MREAGTEYVAVHPKSAVVHQPSTVFDAAKQGPVLLQERNGDEYVLMARSLSDRSARAAAEATRVLALVQAAPEQFPGLPGFAWTTPLPIGERLAMRDDLVLALRRSLEGESWNTYDAELESWRATAEVRADPDVATDLLEDWDRSGAVDLRRP
ncbi:MAG TPA: hypothetical protein VG370_23760 [Chloroflexota bacterium]|nr:hypothetical protein [Chloroflexota bacterium]